MVDDGGLVAARVDSTGTWTGFALVEDIATLRSGIESGSWVDATIGGFASSMDVLATAMDPVGALASMGVAWLMEHVKPLSDPLDQLAGDPDQITAFAQTWDNVAHAAGQSAADLAAAVARDVSQWAGTAAHAYSAHATNLHAGLAAAQEGASGVAVAGRAAGLLVALVRELVRDLVAECVATLLVRVPEWLAEVGLTLGFGTPWVIGQVSSLVAKWVGKIARLLDGLIGSLRRLSPMLSQLQRLLGRLRGNLDDLASVGHTHAPPVARRPADPVPDLPTTPAAGGYHAATPDAPPARPSTPSSPAGSGGYAPATPAAPPHAPPEVTPPRAHEPAGSSAGSGGGRKPPKPPTGGAGGSDPSSEPPHEEGAPDRGHRAPMRTKPAHPPSADALPRGTVTPITGHAEKKRGLTRENEIARQLARQGYDIEQNPGVRVNGAEPDYRIQGQYWDCYSPSTAGVDSILNTLAKKARKQASRLVLDLTDSHLSLSDVASHIDRSSLHAVDELLVFVDGHFVQLLPK